MYESYLFSLSPNFFETDFKQAAIAFASDKIPGKSSKGQRHPMPIEPGGIFRPLHCPRSGRGFRKSVGVSMAHKSCSLGLCPVGLRALRLLQPGTPAQHRCS